ncbi:hypothetical protein [Streptomyces pyxinicus]|uniref:hypothetical protein n=1 Tax=Streptomyces pyxinicus TaxID=2970331 RepID=UPI002867B610|nr:hypothetical protein [Streptomyces sp. LP11]
MSSVLDTPAAEPAGKLAAGYGVVDARVVRPLGPEAGSSRGARVQLKDFTTGACPDPGGPVRPVADWPAVVREAFDPFAEAMAGEARRQGLGRLLRWAAMHWGQSHGASYQLLQTEVGGPSDRLCRSEGLISLGFRHTTGA